MKTSFIFIIFTLFMAFSYIILYVARRKKIQKKSKVTKILLKHVLLTIALCTLIIWWGYLAFISIEFILFKLLLIVMFLAGFYFIFFDDTIFFKIIGIVLVIFSLFCYFAINNIELKRELDDTKTYTLELVQDSDFENSGDIIFEFKNENTDNTEYAIMKYDKDKLKDFDLPKDYKLPLYIDEVKNKATANEESTITIKVIKEKITTLNSMFELSKPKTEVTFEYILDISQDNIKVH